MSTQQQSSFENENINVKVERHPGCRVRLEVAVSPKATQASQHKAMANIRKEVSIPGFRKGKAPEAMIVKNYEKHIEREWKDTLLNSSLDEAIHLIKIYPFNRNSVKSASIKSASLENGSLLTFEYESAPEIPEIDPATLSIQSVPAKVVTEKDVEATINDLRLQSGEWTDVEDRPVQEGDFVVLDIDDISEPGRNLVRETIFQAEKGKMADWMLNLVLGMSINDIAEGMSEKESHGSDCKDCEDGTHSHNDDFVPTKCRIMLHRIRTVVPHAVDDALAKKYGAENADLLRERVKSSLEKRAIDEQKDMQRQLMEKALFQKYPFDIPSSLVAEEVKGAKEAFINTLKEKGASQETISIETANFDKEAAPKYERDIRLFFLAQKISKQHDIKVDSSEIMEELMRQMWLNQTGQSNLNMSMDIKDMQAQIQMRLMAGKALDFLVEKSGSR